MMAKAKHLQRHCFLFLLLFLRLASAADLSVANASEPVDLVEAVDWSCMSLALHEYYSDPSRQPKTQDIPCDSQDKIKEAASSVPNFESGLLKETNGVEPHDTTYGENEACNPLIALSNTSPLPANGYSYPVSTAENDDSDTRDVSTPPYLISHENFASKNDQIEVFGRDKLIKHGQAFDEVAATADTFIHSDSVHPFVGLSDSIEINVNLITWELLRFAIVHLTCLVVMKLLKMIFRWISYHKRIIDFQDEKLVRVYCEVILLSITMLGMINNRSLNSILNVKMLGTNTEDVRPEVGSFQTITPSMAYGQISKEGVEKNNSWLDDGAKQFPKEGEYATSARRKKAYMKLRVRIPFKHVVHKFINLNHRFKGNQLVKTIFSVHSLKWALPSLPYSVSGESFTHETDKDIEELIYELYGKVNNSLSFEDLMHIVIEHRRSTKVVKKRESGLKLKILVPSRNGFRELVNVDHDPIDNRKIVTGYSIDVFEAVMHNLPYRVSYKFFPYENGHSNDMGYHDALIQQLFFNRYDAVLGDITITANRSKYGDFTQPYMMSGVSMIVPVRKDDSTKSLWWFLKPFTLELWLVIIALFLSKGFLIWLFEHRSNPELQGSFPEQVGKILSFSFSIFILAKAKLKSNYSRVVVYLWIVAMLLLATIYAAILQSMMTFDNGGPMVVDVEQLLANQDYVGYQKGSFVFEILKDMGFQEARLKAYSSKDEYATALSKGSHHGGVSAIIDEIPYIKIFLAKYGHQYTMAGQTFKPAGFGFAFRKGCAVTLDVSHAVLRFMEGEEMPELEKKWFGSVQNPLQTPENGIRLSTHGFRSVLLITESFSGMAFTIFIIPVIFKYWKKRRDLSSNRAMRVSNRMASQVVQGESDGAVPSGGHPQMEVAPNDSHHLEMSCQNNSLTAGDDEREQTLHYPARPAVENMATIPPAFL